MISKNRGRRIAVVLIFVLVVASCVTAPEESERRGSTASSETGWFEAFGTNVHIRTLEPVDAAVLDDAVVLIRHIERSTTSAPAGAAPSEVDSVNLNSGVAPVVVSGEVEMVVRTALEIALLTDGAYDPTVGAVTRLWGFRSSAVRAPSGNGRGLRRLDQHWS